MKPCCAFEKEMGVEVIRPDIAGLMGAYGAALFGLRQSQKAHKTASAMMNEQELEAFARRWSASSAAAAATTASSPSTPLRMAASTSPATAATSP